MDGISGESGKRPPDFIHLLDPEIWIQIAQSVSLRHQPYLSSRPCGVSSQAIFYLSPPPYGLQ